MFADLLSSRGIASFGIFVSLLTLTGIVLFVPLLVHQANQLRAEVEEKSAHFKVYKLRPHPKFFRSSKVRIACGKS